MNCTIEFQRKTYSTSTLNQAMDNDAGSWWWWTNVIGTLFFGTIGLIGNTICFLVVCRFALPQHSFVQYLRALAIFDFLYLLYEYIQSLNDLFIYLYSINLLNFRFSIFCKIYEYSKHTIILLACWTIVGLTFDRLILVCDPWSKKWPNLSRRICNSQCAKKIIFFFIVLSLIINIPHLIYQEWICRQSGFQHSAAFYGKSHSDFQYDAALNRNDHFNQTQINSTKYFSGTLQCKCRISPNVSPETTGWIIKWKTYVFHLFCYTLIPAIILIASNIAILKVLHTPRQIVGQQNEHLRSKLTRTLTLVSLMFLILYFPHAIVETFLIEIFLHYHSACNIRALITLRILERLSELLNIAALGINFFLYILGVNHYRSAAIQMLGLHHFDMFLPYLTVEHRNSMGSLPLHTHSQYRRNTQIDGSSIKLLKVINHEANNDTSNLSSHDNGLKRVSA